MKSLKEYILEAEIGVKFKSLASYTKNMAKGIEDKLFFVEKLPLKKYDNWVFVDFGCADGVLINALLTILPKYGVKGKLIGFDISESMISLANKKVKKSDNKELKVMFTSNWNDVVSELEKDNSSTKVLICNSVIHEVYSYASDKSDIDLFWKRVKNTGFDFVCIRDMMADKNIVRKTDEDLLKTFYKHVDEKKPELNKYIDDFENHWGSLKENKNFIHYLLKYRWTTNWNREVNENYFPIMEEDFLNKMNDFNRIYYKRFRVPFLEGCWLNDFGVKLKDDTHIKVIFSK